MINEIQLWGHRRISADCKLEVRDIKMEQEGKWIGMDKTNLEMTHMQCIMYSLVTN